MALSTRNVSTTVNTAIQTLDFEGTHAYTVGAGTELLVVVARWEGADSAQTSISGVRWADNLGLNEEALTEAIYVESTASGEDVGCGIWYLVNPTARVGQVEVSYVNGALDISSWSISALEVIGGVDTAAPIGATNTNSGINTNASLSLTSTVANSLIISSLAHYGGDTDPHTPAAGITAELADGATGTNVNSDHSYWIGECLTTTVGSYDVGATGAANDDFAVAAVEVKPTAGGVEQTVGLVTETDSGAGVSAAKTFETGLATETSAALGVAAAKALDVGLASEAASALAVTHAKAAEVGLATETSAALGVAAAKALDVGLVSEAASAPAVAHAKAAEVGLATETSAPLGVAAAKALSVGLASEAASALAVTHAKAAEVGLATEIGTALGLAGVQAQEVGLASEANAAPGVAAAKAREVGLPETLDTATAVSAAKARDVGVAAEADQALAVSAAKVLDVGLAAEGDAALALAPAGAPGTPGVRIVIDEEARAVLIGSEERAISVPDVERRILMRRAA